MANEAVAPDADLVPRDRRPTTYLIPVSRRDGSDGWVEVDEAGLAAYRQEHPLRPLEELIGAWGTSDEEWEAYLRWEDEGKRLTPPTPPMDEQIRDWFGDDEA